MSDTDQRGDNNARQESVQLLGLWVVTMVVAIIFISSLSTRGTDGAKEPAEAEHLPAAQIEAPPLDTAQTLAPLPAGHPSIEQLRTAAEAASPVMPGLPAGHPPLTSAPAVAPVEAAKADNQY
ncbi:MAG: hypothetical protein L3J26_09455 [Candidatus Polarisedimenticolaceae bacterium]|nr:hypothetical protein [Candidatus Polarisedimenticolaceae bacterium]